MTATVFRREILRGTVISDIDVLEAAAMAPPEIPYPPAGHGLLGRRDECGVLDRLVAGVRAGKARYSCCAARRAPARRRCSTTCGNGRPGARSSGGRRRIRDGPAVRGAAPAVRAVP